MLKGQSCQQNTAQQNLIQEQGQWAELAGCAWVSPVLHERGKHQIPVPLLSQRRLLILPLVAAGIQAAAGNDEGWKQQHLKMESWPDSLSAKSDFSEGMETNGASLDDCPHCLTLLFHIPEVPRRQRLVGSQFPSPSWEGGQ